ncbi:MAG: SMC-Scp complex subunit ScpB, partial [Fibrobacter sp.]|nr:SMC-Scp complex subunit ScpB [Fibrobacter sp.]
MSKKERDEVVENEEKSSERNDSTESMRILEALLFASEELLTVTKIKSILPDNPDARSIRKIVEKINAQLQKERHPFEIVEIGGGYQFRTVAYYHPWVRQIFKEKAAKKLSIQALECLAIIAYKQPISKAEIEAVRGVVSDGAMKTLLERRLVTIAGRSDKPGRPLLYGTTTEFLKYFGLNKMEDLPKIEEFEAIARDKVDELSLEELQKENDMESERDSENIENSGSAAADAVQAESDGGKAAEESSDKQAESDSGDEKNAEKKSEESAETGSEEIDPNSYGEDSAIDSEGDEELPEGSDELQYVPEPEGTALFEIDISEDPDDAEVEA